MTKCQNKIKQCRLNFSRLAIACSATLAQAPWAQAQDNGYAIEEVVVTARKRVESLQETPLAVTTFSPTEMAERGFSDISQISESTPGLTFNTTAANSGSSNAAVIFIRGIGQSDFYPQIDPGVGIYLDGVYISRTTGGVLDVVDISQVEILRGPQGTLFGKNTIGGAIVVNTKKPASSFGGGIELLLGADNRRDLKASLNLPISDAILSRWSLSSLARDGYVTSQYDGSEYGDVDSLSARGLITWDVSDSLSLDLSGDITKKREASAGSVLLNVANGSHPGDGTSAFVWNTLVAPTLPGGASGANLFNQQWLSNDPYKNYADGQLSRSNLDLWGAAATLNWAISESLEFKSISAFRSSDSDTLRDGDGSPLTILHPATLIEQEQFSQEFQLSGDYDGLNWLLGLFYMKEDIYYDMPVDIAFVATENHGDVANESRAIFAQGSYRITDKLNLTAGVRYTEDDKSNDTVVKTRSNPGFVAAGPGVIGGALPVPPGIPLLIDSASETFKQTSALLTVDYSVSDEFMLYASYSEGFKSGGFSQRIAFPRAKAPSFGPELVTSYEAGFKYSGWQNRLRLNGAAYFVDYEDLQVVVFNQIEPINENAGEAEINGLELELLLLPSENLEISSSLGYTNAKYTQIDPGSLINKSNDLAYTPLKTASISAIYTLALNDELGKIKFRMDWSYRDDSFFDALNTVKQDAYDLINAAIIYTSADENWQLILSGKNLTDEEYLIAGFSDLPTSSFADGSYARSRQWGLSAKYQF